MALPWRTAAHACPPSGSRLGCRRACPANGGVEPGGESFDELFGLIRRSEAYVPLIHVDTPAVLIGVYLDIDVHRNLQSAREQGLAYRFVVRWRPADGPEDQGALHDCCGCGASVRRTCFGALIRVKFLVRRGSRLSEPFELINIKSGRRRWQMIEARFPNRRGVSWTINDSCSSCRP